MQDRSFSDDDQESSPSFTLSCTLKVEKLSRNVEDCHLKDIFSNFGDLTNFKVSIDPKVKLSLGWATITYKNRNNAEKAYRFMNGAQIDGKKITLKFMQTVENNHYHHRFLTFYFLFICISLHSFYEQKHKKQYINQIITA